MNDILLRMQGNVYGTSEKALLFFGKKTPEITAMLTMIKDSKSKMEWRRAVVRQEQLDRKINQLKRN